jgi:hypothetical protein
VAGTAAKGVFVVGMDRSGTSVATRLIGLLGPRLPPTDDVIAARSENPRGVWESSTLTEFNVRVLQAVGSDDRFPLALESGWEHDPRLDGLRAPARAAVGRVFPVAPWAWKDPLHCLTFAFWRDVVSVDPVVVLVTRNPLEIAASAHSAWGREKIYGLALWERYLRQALEQVRGLPMLVTDYAQLLGDPLGWAATMHRFLASAGVAVSPVPADEVASYVDPALRHSAHTSDDLLSDGDVSGPQRTLFLVLQDLRGAHDRFEAPALPAETPTTEALFAERRRAFEIKSDLERQLELERRSGLLSRVRRSPRLAPLRARLAARRDRRPPLHVLHVGKTGGTALKHVLAAHQDEADYRLLFRGHEVGISGVPAGERFMFLIRDPLSRFVSAFNGRLREDRPRYHYPWREEEREAFAIFRTPNELALALSSADPERRAAAVRAMNGIGHLNTPYSFWFGDEAAFRSRVPDVFFIGFQDRLDEDFEALRRRLGLPATAQLPRDDTTAHRAPSGLDHELEDEARANLESWYARDIAFVELCRELAPQVNARD